MECIQCAVGTPPNLQVFALLPKSFLYAAMQSLRFTPTDGTERELTLVEIVQIGMVWRIARQTQGLPDEDPLAPPSPAAHDGGPSAAVASHPICVEHAK